MTRIFADISVSLDGFVTGPDPGPDSGLGTGGEGLHTWAFSDDPDDRRILREATARSGAVVLIAAARARAEAASSDTGKDRDVVLMGGGALIRSALDAGLVDVLSLHLAPVVLGAGTPLFTGGTPRTLVQRTVTATSTATHLTYDVR
ncbi:dihydrofolate reductase [Mycobacterium tuberculosis]|nr:dihydrofolate reductase [Mycobacterium tuberculosis]